MGTFEHRLRQLFDEQRHAVGALDDLFDDLVGKTGIAGEALDESCTVLRIAFDASAEGSN
jgi:hypothetical protein